MKQYHTPPKIVHAHPTSPHTTNTAAPPSPLTINNTVTTIKITLHTPENKLQKLKTEPKIAHNH